jgi:hypothetical protein
MCVPPKDTSRLRACETQAGRFVDLNPQSRDRNDRNYGLKSEVLYVSKLGRAKIISTAEKKFLGGTKWSDPWLSSGDNP